MATYNSKLVWTALDELWKSIHTLQEEVNKLSRTIRMLENKPSPFGLNVPKEEPSGILAWNTAFGPLPPDAGVVSPAELFGRLAGFAHKTKE
jgi:hypothetical protein